MTKLELFIINANYQTMNNKGFTLIEIAIVLLVLGLVIGGLLGPLSTRIEQGERQQTQAQLEEIREALMGYAILQGYLPCPSSVASPDVVGFGEPANPCLTNTEGYLPWKVLGVSGTDAWGIPWVYRVDQNYAKGSSTPISLNSGFSNNLLIHNAAGKSLISTSQHPVAIVFSRGKDRNPNGENADPSDKTYESNPYISDPNNLFDDMMIWLTKPVLIYRMVQAGRLP